MQMRERSRKMLKRSFICVGISWLLILSTLPFVMSSVTEKVIIEVSNKYIAEVNKQIKQKFSSIISLRILQVDGICKRTPSHSEESRESILDQLRISAEVRDFSSLCFLSEEGKVETVYGDDIILIDREAPLNYIKNKEKIVTRGYNQEGESVLILGTEADYEMNNGQRSVALLASVPMDYLKEVLFIQEEESDLHFHIIDDNGDFVIKGIDIPENNYFDSLRSGVKTYDGKSVDVFIEGLQSKIQAHEDCAAFFYQFGEEKHIYCSAIYKNFDWYIVMIMPKAVLGQALSKLDEIWAIMFGGSIGIITIGIFIVFIMYVRLKEQEMKELERTRKEAVLANRAKSEFLSSMSHDIRTPMNAIIGMTELALRDGQEPEQVQGYLKKISASSKQLLGLINDILDMSKIESGKVKLKENLISLRDIVNDNITLIRPLTKSKNLQFDVYVQDMITEKVNGDGIRLNQMLMNLLSNSVKFTLPGGKIHLYLYQEKSPKGDLYVRTHIYVSDTGIGMSKEFQKKIFETFAREESEHVQQINGTGLGMAIIKSIVDLMGGSIELVSEVDKGTEIHMTLDLKKEETQEEKIDFPKWNMLVMDQQTQFVFGALECLWSLEIQAEGTEHIKQGIQMLEEHIQSKTPYDFILLDWKMLKEDAIQDFYKALENLGDVRPVVLVMAYDRSDVEEADESLFDGLIQKPFFASALSEYLTQYMEKWNESSEKKRKQQADFSGKRILLAEDIDINWEIAYEMLSSLGMELERAINGKECVEKIQNAPLGYYDAILMDIRMPVMNGYDATKAIRKLEREDKDLPIIAMTADAFVDDVQYCIDCGMNGHLAKPVDLKECISLLSQFLK